MDKYKAKRSDTGEWAEGYLMDENYINIPFTDYDAGGRFDDPLEIDEATICRPAIGNLWENDIVEYEGKKGIVRFGEYDNKHYGFYIDWQQDDLLRKDILFWTDKVKAIGNVFDAPDLLGGDGDDGTNTGR